MCAVPVFYAADDHTRLIAERLAAALRRHGLDSRAIPIVCEETSHLDWNRLRAVALVALLHDGRHQAEARAFAHLNAGPMSGVPSLFVSVSPSAAPSSSREMQTMTDAAYHFVADAGWQPTQVGTVSSGHAYTPYDRVVRLSMRASARKNRAAADTMPAHDIDWAAVDRCADGLAGDVPHSETDDMVAVETA